MLSPREQLGKCHDIFILNGMKPQAKVTGLDVEAVVADYKVKVIHEIEH